MSFFDLFLTLSVVGIWPRWGAPYRISITRKQVSIPHLPPDLIGLKIIQLSDLHFHKKIPLFFQKKIIKALHSLSPDLVLFTGDFLCYSDLDEQLLSFLSQIHAPYGCFAILGNHDYQSPVGINDKGEYDHIQPESSFLIQGYHRLFSQPKLACKVTKRAKETPIHRALKSLLQKTSFTLLHNSHSLVPIKGSSLNICGLGEYTLGQCQPEKAFTKYRPEFPGIILTHNPDSFPLLTSYPGDILLAGHTHGGQINLPFLWKRITLMENPKWKRGAHIIGKKWAYVNRGLGGVFPCRLFSSPEILQLTLERSL